MTPERIAELEREYVGKCSPHRHHCTRGDWAWMTLDILELIGAVKSAQAEIADLKRGGVVVPDDKFTPYMRHCLDTIGIRAIPADRVLREGDRVVGHEEWMYLAALERYARKHGPESIQDAIECLDHLRAQPTQAPANGIRHVHV